MHPVLKPLRNRYKSAHWARIRQKLQPVSILILVLFRLSALFLFRFDARRFSGLLFQEPPRITRSPPLGPFPF
jgi:hypothetical protein